MNKGEKWFGCIKVCMPCKRGIGRMTRAHPLQLIGRWFKMNFAQCLTNPWNLLSQDMMAKTWMAFKRGLEDKLYGKLIYPNSVLLLLRAGYLMDTIHFSRVLILNKIELFPSKRISILRLWSDFPTLVASKWDWEEKKNMCSWSCLQESIFFFPSVKADNFNERCGVTKSKALFLSCFWSMWSLNACGLIRC